MSRAPDKILRHLERGREDRPAGSRTSSDTVPPARSTHPKPRVSDAFTVRVNSRHCLLNTYKPPPQLMQAC